MMAGIKSVKITVFYLKGKFVLCSKWGKLSYLTPNQQFSLVGKKWVKVTVWIFRLNWYLAQSIVKRTCLGPIYKYKIFKKLMTKKNVITGIQKKVKVIFLIFQGKLIIFKEPLFGRFWAQNWHISYFLFHCLIFQILLVLELGFHCFFVLV